MRFGNYQCMKQITPSQELNLKERHETEGSGFMVINLRH